jgi:hypothetical protein
MRRVVPIAILWLVFLCAAPARAQSFTQKNNEFGIWAGYSFGTTYMLAITEHRQLGVLGLRYGRTLVGWRTVAVEWTLDVTPAEIVIEPEQTFVLHPTGPQSNVLLESGRMAVYGGGVSPLGFKVNFLRQRRLQVFGAATCGLIASVAPVPINRVGGTQFNFKFDFQGGIQRFNSAHDRAWMIGYKLQHISNAARSDVNPGVTFNVIFLGYSFFK